MDMGGWLRGLGLGQYEENFRDNKIDADLLPRLTDAGLKDIGVSALGDRLRLLDAIAALVGAAPSNIPTRSPKPAPPTSPELAAERRPITVMFCDLVGSTALASRLDAEDWRNLVNAYLDEASKAVTGFGGHVLKRLGDGLMALFGYPQAQENDAERAVRAALAIQRALADLNARNARSGAPELSARIGLECGSVVVDAAGEVFGEAPNVAARVQAAAEPGSVLVTGNVQRQVAGLFVVEEKGAHELKGVAQPLSLYRVVRASGGGRRGGMRVLTSFVGREEDIGTLLRRWDRVRAGEGQFVQIVGEPGLGKSRLVEEFHSRLGETPHTWVEWNSSQLLQNTPLHPVAEWGRARFGGQDVAAERRLADLETTLAQIKLDVQETATLLAPLLDIPLPAERAPKFSPEELRRRQLAAMVALVLAGARTQPVVLAFEDLHWADPTSLDLIQALAERGAQAPLLVVATTRPEFRAPWGMRSHHAVVALVPLDRTEVRRMVGEIAAQHALPQEVVERVSERTGGVPLFVEEVTRLLLERGDTGSHAVPPTLQQSLAARLDRLGAAREVAQVGAVLGRDFSYVLLRDVAEADEPAMQASLDRLAGADLLFVEGAAPEAKYRFKHALIQDAAYESLLKSRRQVLHRRAAEILRDQPEHAAEPEAIAHHFTQAGLNDLAIEWWGKAGDEALRRSAFSEAIAHLGKAIAMADKAGADSAPAVGDEATSHQRMKLHSDYSQAMMWSKGFAAEETKAALARAANLAAKSDDFSERFAAAFGQWTTALVRSELQSAREQASAFLREAEAAGRVTEAGVARRGLAVICYYLGDLAEARTHCERALDSCYPHHEDEARERYGEYTGTNATAILAATNWQLGEVERARELIDIANRRAAERGHPPSMAIPLIIKCQLEILRGDAAAALSAAEALEVLSQEHGMMLFLVYAELFAAWARGRLHDPATGTAELRQTLAGFADQGNMLDAPFFYALLAELEAEALDAERALAGIDEALALAIQIEQRCHLAFMHRLRGQILLKRDPSNPAPAEEAYKTAFAIANEQGARSFGLQAVLALAKLYQSTGRPLDAHALLAPALEGFSPTPEMPEIAEAQTLFAALAETDEVKASEAHRQRRLHLQTAYGQAMMWAKGFAAEETKAALARAAELGERTNDFSVRFAVLQGQWAAAGTAGELRSARKLGLTLLREAEDAGRVREARTAHWLLGMAAYWHGDFVEARARCERALAGHVFSSDPEVQEHFDDYRTWAVLAAIMWQLGEVERARELIEWANLRASEVGDFGAIADALFWKSYLEIWRGDQVATLSAAEALERLARERGIAQYLNEAELHLGWARGRISDPKAGAAEVRRVLSAFVDQGVKVNLGFYTGLLAQLEAETLGAEAALARIDEAFRLSSAVEHRCSLPFLHRLRGEFLLKRNPADPATAEEAFQTSIAIAKEQGARSPVLLASLAVAKLYQSMARPIEAHAVLAPALEGFAPTPEMPEIAEAMSLSARLA